MLIMPFLSIACTRRVITLQVGHELPSKLAPNIRGIMMTSTSADNLKEISRLLQLLLGCAINSPGREEFVNKIRLNMEPSAQVSAQIQSDILLFFLMN